MPSITVVGSINRDIVGYVDRHPVPGETILGRRSATFPGGKGANQAVAAARLRARSTDRVRMIGRVGPDGFGDEMRAFLAGEGIDVSDVTIAESATGIALILVDAEAQNAITVISGANSQWPAELPPLRVSAGDVVICQLEIPLPIVVETFAQARAAGATTLLNPAPFQPLPAALLQTTDILVLNEIELGQMLGREKCDAHAHAALVAAVQPILQRGPRAVVVTLGQAGALVIDASERVERVSPVTVRAVDTTGAGDCFVGALAAALIDDADVVAAARFANRAAALSVTREGAASSIPVRREVESLA